MTEGFQRFFEGKENVVKFYSSYTDWYDDISRNMQRNQPYIYKEMFFVKIAVENKEKSKLFVNFCRRSGWCLSSFNMNILHEGWTHDATKFSILKIHDKYLKWIYMPRTRMNTAGQCT